MANEIRFVHTLNEVQSQKTKFACFHIVGSTPDEFDLACIEITGAGQHA